MKRFILSLLMLGFAFAAQAQFAGPDKTIMREEGNTQTTTLGTADGNSKTCYIWSGPHIVGDRNKAVITVNPINDVESYSVKRISENGVEEDMVFVHVEDSVQILYVHPKYRCYPEDATLSVADFEISTYPAGYENLAQFSPSVAHAAYQRVESDEQITVSITKGNHTSSKTCSIHVINDGAVASGVSGSVDIGKIVELLKDGQKLKDLLNGVKQATDLTKQIPGTPCTSELELTYAKVGVTPKKICCDHGSYLGATISFGGCSGSLTTKCNIPAYGIPGVGTLDLVFSFAISGGLGAIEATVYPGAMSCGSLCIPVFVGISIGGGVGVSAFGDILSADLQLVASGQGSLTWCPWGTTKVSASMLAKVEIVGKVTLLTFIEESVSYPLLSKSVNVPL